MTNTAYQGAVMYLQQRLLVSFETFYPWVSFSIPERKIVMESQLSTTAMTPYMHAPSECVTKGQVCITLPEIIKRGLPQRGGSFLT